MKRPIVPLPLDAEAPDRLLLLTAPGHRLKMERCETEDGRIIQEVAPVLRPRLKRKRILRKVG